MFAYCVNNPINYDDSQGLWPKLSISRINSNTLRIKLSASLSTIATFFAYSAFKSAVATAICGMIPGGQIAAGTFAIVSAAQTFATYLLDKYAGSKRVYISLQFSYSIKVSYKRIWIVYPITMATITTRYITIKNVRVSGGLS